MSTGASSNKRSRKDEENRPASQQLESWSRQSSTIITLKHTWSIENFSRLSQKIGESLYSPIFSDQSENKVEWKLQLYPKGRNEEHKDFITVFLWLHNPQPDFKVTTTYKFSLLNKTNAILVHTADTTMQFNGQSSKGWGSNIFDQNKITPTTLPGDELHVKCEVTYAISQTCLSGLLLLPSSGSGNWLEHFKQLFESKLLSDVVIRVKKERFDAHKNILAARSSVFLAMFQSELTETQTNTVKIEGIEPAVFKEVLRFIYTDQVEQLDELAKELFEAAERYMLDFLKEKCVSHLATKISVENCAELLLLADLHSAAELKTFVLDFFRSRASDVAQTASWQQLMESANPHLLRDISKALISKTGKTSGAVELEPPARPQ